MDEGDHLFLVDGSAYIFRAYHALPPLTRKSDGLPIGAVSGFCNMLWRLLEEARDTSVGVTPSHFAVVFDYSSTTFRNEIYPAYKANRTDPPEDLVPQFALIREATRAFNVACLEQEGYEADDLIATYARQAEAKGADTTIISSDKDLMQLIGARIVMYDSMKDRRVDVSEVEAKFGVPPTKMVDLQALAGDSTDNVPGVPGIGAKTAATLLHEFGTLEELLSRAGEIPQKKRRENLVAFADQARLSKRLVQLEENVPLDVPLEDLALEPLDGPKLVGFLKGLELTTLTRRVAAATETDAAHVDAKSVEVDGYEARGPDLDPVRADGEEGGWTPASLAAARAAEAMDEGVSRANYETVSTLDDLDRWIARARDTRIVAVDTETDSLDAMQAQLVGVSLAVEPGEACYVPLLHKEGSGDLLSGGGLAQGQIPQGEALARLKPLLEDRGVLKVAQNLKFDWLVLSRHGIEVAPYDDTMLLSYALDAGRTKHGMDTLSEQLLAHTPIPYEAVAGTGKAKVTFDLVPIDKASAYAAEDADVTLRLWRVLKPRLAAEGMTTVYERLERPLVPVVARMERQGIAIDRVILSRISSELAQKAAEAEDMIYEIAGGRFNIGSPKQLGEILFGQMGLPGGRKTKTGQYSTSVQVLEDLAAEGHELPTRIVEWRQLTKLKSTYTDALPAYVNPETKRVHTSFSLAATTTGRFSSSEPNLQNIPVRTEVGRRIRTAFVAEEGNLLVSADYSQIELRILAHVAEVPQLRQAFAEGVDIHAMTASEMFDVPLAEMDADTRRKAKTVNFGIIYGISAFGLAARLGIDRGVAGDYIKLYFDRFPGIRDYIEDTKRTARERGYVETVFGRRAHYPDIRSSNPQMRAFNERAAINAPIQGTAADIIRRAMVRVDPALRAAGLDARMLLQVHDELIFEVPRAQVDETIALVRDIMVEAPMPAVQLRVPLQVDARAAANWDEAH